MKFHSGLCVLVLLAMVLSAHGGEVVVHRVGRAARSQQFRDVAGTYRNLAVAIRAYHSLTLIEIRDDPVRKKEVRQLRLKTKKKVAEGINFSLTNDFIEVLKKSGGLLEAAEILDTRAKEVELLVFNAETVGGRRAWMKAYESAARDVSTLTRDSWLLPSK